MALVNSQISALAEVTSGWTGAVTITVGATVATYTPSGRSSAFEVLRGIGREAVRVHGVTVGGWATSAGVLAIRSTVVFSLAATGTTMGRLGLTGTLSASNEYTFPSAYAGGVIPDYGANARSAMIQVKPGKAAATGAGALSAGLEAAGARVNLFDDLAGVVDLAAELDAGGTYDAAVFSDDDEMPLVRLRVRGIQLMRWGMLASNARVVARCVEVRA